jgi:hypothetical protein
LALKLN